MKTGYNRKFKINGGKSVLSLLLLRMVLPLLIFFLIIRSKPKLSLYLFVLTAFVAFLDGFLAKRNKVKSQLRSMLDPFADKMFVNAVAIALFLKGFLPFWVVCVFLVKDSLIILGALFILIKNTKTIFRTNVVDKVAVFIQLFTLFVVLTGRLDYVLIWISIGFVVLSFITTL